MAKKIYNEVAICMQTKHIDNMIAYCDKLGVTTDRKIGEWAAKTGLEIYYPLPSLIDHRKGHSYFRAMTGKKQADRTAVWFEHELHTI